MAEVDKVPTEGEALERTSTMSLFSREWNNCYWVLQGETLLLYPNKEMYVRVSCTGGHLLVVVVVAVVLVVVVVVVVVVAGGVGEGGS